MGTSTERSSGSKKLTQEQKERLQRLEEQRQRMEEKNENLFFCKFFTARDIMLTLFCV